ncbi:conserved hypothetical protein [Leishmania infantum JPCM5]|uniref:Uncharacterized protein n=2 Tax=Leishmania infantum TaxID=5671 RepID=A4HZ71_LEIIN|nr:conserved hypothetical protein [Leishmania infantum JPCM5]CAM67804.1 conserved hypothetical protein [Leishmania infantum JPCM5]|eukprot:XP_001465383.1 conserved hypothetical protein [Leishmania infantum JPCM5]
MQSSPPVASGSIARCETWPFPLRSSLLLLLPLDFPVFGNKGGLVVCIAHNFSMLRLSMHRTSPPFWVGARLLSSTAVLRVEQSAEERAREEELRQKVQQKYRGMPIPEMTHHEYGHFSTMGINASAAQQAARSAGVQGYPGFGGGAFQNRGRVDWLFLLTGCTMVYLSGKILFRQFTRGVNGLELPLWTASVELQAKHILFAVQFQQSEQEQMKKDFEAVRQTNPFVDFFEWVRSRRPEFCSGRKYGADYVMHTLVSCLRGSDGTQLATLARTLQQSMTRRNGDSLQRVDDFVEQLQSAGYLFHGIRGVGSSGMYTPEPLPQPIYTPFREVSQCGAQESDLINTLDVKNGEAHSSTPFSEAK